jgi:hypothetical protein
LLHLNPGSGCGKAFVVKLVNPNPWRPLRYKDLLCKKKKRKKKKKKKKLLFSVLSSEIKIIFCIVPTLSSF